MRMRTLCPVFQKMDEFPARKEPGSEKDAKDVSQQEKMDEFPARKEPGSEKDSKDVSQQEKMDEFSARKEPGSEKDAKDVSGTVVEVLVKADGSSLQPAGKENTAREQEPPGIVKTPQSFEDGIRPGIQHTTDPQKPEEDKEPPKYTF